MKVYKVNMFIESPESLKKIYKIIEKVMPFKFAGLTVQEDKKEDSDEK